MRISVRYCFTGLLLVAMPLVAQIPHGCPLAAPGSMYENPLLDRGLSDYDVKFYHIDLEMGNTSTVISGSGAVLVSLLESSDSLLLELASGLDVTDVVVDSVLHPGYVHSGDRLTVSLGSVREAGELVMIKVFYHGDAGQDRGFFAGITSSKDYSYNQMVTYTLSEPMNASDWFPVKEVLEDKADSAWIFITTDKSLMAGSQGLLEEVVSKGLNKHQFRWKTRYPVAYYLLSATVADYRDFSFSAPLSVPGDSVLVQNFIFDNDVYFENNRDKILETAGLIGLYSTLLIDYPWKKEKYGHCVAPMGGGMEHQTMTTLSGFNFTLIAHELAHQWFGDYITCGDWRDIWINEGFASYMEYLALQNLKSQEEADAWLAQAMSLALEKDGTVYVPEEDVEDTWRLFDYSLSYKKGACLLHMIRFELNDDQVFFRTLKNYLDQYGLKNATGSDFRTVLEETSGMDFSCFFDQWYYGFGYPTFSMVWYKEGDSLVIKSRETGSSVKTPFFRTSFELTVKTDSDEYSVRLTQTESEQTFIIPETGAVAEVAFNLKGDILATGTILHRFPEGRVYTLGPNPFSEALVLQFAAPATERMVSITGIDGKESARFSFSDQSVKLPLSQLQDGPYLLTITDGENQYTDKVIKVSEN
ncbi:MAG: M1 family aminopeptidase [Bacteroidota bacterium]